LATFIIEGRTMYGLKSEAYFDSAHFLADYHGKCENLHGHRWKVVAYLRQDSLGDSGTERDMVMDFGEFKRVLRGLADELDHTFLVEEGTLMDKTIECLKEEGFSLTMLPFRTTSENLAHYFFDRLHEAGLPCSRVEVYETPLNCAIYEID
jgi:6-pyruvoyltetrahydropterin/6-carboxytetrahydropterin synthase